MRYFSIIAFLIFFFGAFPAEVESLNAAAEVEFSYAAGGMEKTGYGYGRPDTYDVGIRVENPGLAGAMVRGLRVEIPAGGTLAPVCHAWIAMELPDEAFSESNTIAFVEAEVEASEGGGVLTARFPEGVEIGENGIYAGYSVEAVEVENRCRTFPVATVAGTTPGALWLRTGDHPRWDNGVERLEMMSRLTLTLEKQLPECAASIQGPAKHRSLRGVESPAAFRIYNEGGTEIRSVRYTCSNSGNSGEIEIIPAIPARFGEHAEVEIPLTGDSGFGKRVAEVRIMEVNGQPNECPTGAASIIIETLPEMPVNRPLVEEYTGLWCGSCPSGWVALEECNEKYGRDFVAISYHVNDDMQTGIAFPGSANSTPTIYLNRLPTKGAASLMQQWEEESRKEQDVALTAELEWMDEGRSRLRARGKAYFTEDEKSPKYRFAIALVADGLNDPSWAQTNYFAGQPGSGKFWDLFTKGGGKVYGLDYNFTALLFDNPKGVEEPFAGSIKAYEEYAYEEEFDLERAINRRGASLVQDKGRLRAIAMIISPDGVVMNSASSGYSADAPDVSGISGPDAEEGEKPEVRYFDFSGRMIKGAAKGEPAIRVKTYPDGRVESDKIITN